MILLKFAEIVCRCLQQVFPLLQAVLLQSSSVAVGQTDRAKRACKGLLETRPAHSMAALASQQAEPLEERLKLYR